MSAYNQSTPYGTSLIVCLFLFVCLQVVVSEADAARGLKILPSERVISMVDSPATSVIEFSQFVAEVSGTIRCIGKC